MISRIGSLALAMLLLLLSIPAAMTYASSCLSHYDNCNDYTNPYDSFNPLQEEEPPQPPPPPPPPEEEPPPPPPPEDDDEEPCSEEAGQLVGAGFVAAGVLLAGSGAGAWFGAWGAWILSQDSLCD